MALIAEPQWTMHEFAGHQIRMRKSDGYLSATDMCKANNKEWSNYKQNNQTKEFLIALEDDLKNNDVKPLIDTIMIGLNEFRGTWVHPRVATHLALWISNAFFIKLSKWIEEWKLTSNANMVEYLNELCVLTPSFNQQKESEIRNKLKIELNAKIEVKTDSGYIDLLSDKLIIELKEFSQWKGALGQILSYGIFYPNHQKQIYLFGEIQKDKINLIKQIYSKYDVMLVIIE